MKDPQAVTLMLLMEATAIVMEMLGLCAGEAAADDAVNDRGIYFLSFLSSLSF